MKIEEIIPKVQRLLGVAVDGKAGPETWEAIYKHIADTKGIIEDQEPKISEVDERSEKVISTLLPDVQSIARALVQKATSNGIQIKIISGLRSYEEQNELYAQGRTKPGNIVTKAKAGFSNHNFGIAFDIGVFEGKKYITESAKYKAVGVLGMELGLEWGGNWKSIVDQPHFQLRPLWAIDMLEKEMLAELRRRAQNGQHAFS